MEGLNMSIWTLALLIAIALAFDFMNGFHDGANSISTIVATGALTPKQAVLFAAFFNFAALWVFQLKVAATIGKGTVDPSFVDYYVIFGALDRGARLEHHHLVLRHPVVVFARAGRWPGRGDGGQGRFGGADRLGGFRQDPRLHHHFAAGRGDHRRSADGAGGLDLPRHLAVSGREVLQERAVVRRCRLQPGPRRQRRAEDDRHHLAADDHRRAWRPRTWRRCRPG
jgi:hypothetical protein